MPDISARKTQLEARLAELDSRVHTIEDRLDDPVSKDWAEQATEREDSEVLESMGAAGLREIEAIRAALARIDEGSYGECVRCGDLIAEKRLELVPHAPLCRTCAQG